MIRKILYAVVALCLFTPVVAQQEKQIQDTFFGCKFGYSQLKWFFVDPNIGNRIQPFDESTAYMTNASFGGVQFDYILFYFGSNDKLFDVDFITGNLNMYNVILNQISKVYPLQNVYQSSGESVSGKQLSHEQTKMYTCGNKRIVLQINRAASGEAKVVLSYTDLILQQQELNATYSQW